MTEIELGGQHRFRNAAYSYASGLGRSNLLDYPGDDSFAEISLEPQNPYAAQGIDSVLLNPQTSCSLQEMGFAHVSWPSPF